MNKIEYNFKTFIGYLFPAIFVSAFIFAQLCSQTKKCTGNWKD